MPATIDADLHHEKARSRPRFFFAAARLAAAIVLPLVLFHAAPAHAQQAAFDHSHGRWNVLLKAHVLTEPGGHATRVRYAAMARERNALKEYLAALSGVTEAEYRSWERARQMAFLINAYNAFTVEKILTRYPGLRSIRDFGRFIGNPWRDAFFELLGRRMHLDHLEHEILRAKGVFDEPRIHYAVNCAAVGCPALREEAYVAGRLDEQLEHQARRFLSDRTRNRFDAARRSLEVSRIFDWYAEDWTSGYRGIKPGAPAIASREQYFARYAELLSDDPAARRAIAEGRVALTFLEYDWTLNDAR